MPSNDEETRKAIVSAYNKMYAAKNRERINAKCRERRQNNREAILERDRDRIKAWHAQNSEARKEHTRRYREKNREKIREASRNFIRDENGEIKYRTADKERHRQPEAPKRIRGSGNNGRTPPA